MARPINTPFSSLLMVFFLGKQKSLSHSFLPERILRILLSKIGKLQSAYLFFLSFLVFVPYSSSLSVSLWFSFSISLYLSLFASVCVCLSLFSSVSQSLFSSLFLSVSLPFCFLSLHHTTHTHNAFVDPNINGFLNYRPVSM